MRALLRLEFLYAKANHHRDTGAEYDTRAALDVMFEINEVAGRAELRGELVKELERYATNLSAMRDHPGVDASLLDGVLGNLHELASKLSAMSGGSTSFIKEHELLSSLRQRSSIPGGACAFDLPALHRWLQQPWPTRRKQVDAWYERFEPVRQATDTLLQLTRQSAASTQEKAEDGFFQAELDPNRPFQLVQVTLPLSVPVFPEISGGRHRFTIRFMEQQDLGDRPSQVHRDIEFQLRRCMI